MIDLAIGYKCIWAVFLAVFFFVKIKEDSKKFMPDSKPEPPYEGAKLMLTVTIWDDRTAMQNMVEEMYPELPERKP